MPFARGQRGAAATGTEGAVTETGCVVVCTTLPADADGAAFGRTLVGERLAACVSVLPGARSVYRWRDAVEEDDEQQVVIKTSRSGVEQLVERIGQMHPYDVPEIVVLPVIGGGAAYLDWIRASTSA